MTINRILAEKQDNGLWGTPHNLYKIDMSILPKDELHLLVSAIIIKFDEMYHIRFKCDVGDTSMRITHDVNNGFTREKTYIIHYKDYRIVNDKLYWLETDDDKLTFSRMMKLKKLKEKVY